MALVFACADLAVAQVRTGVIEGTIRDATDGAVAGATVTLASDEGVVRERRVADAAGVFAFDHVPFGRFRLGVAMAGFTPVLQDVVVHSNLPVRVRVVLRVGPLSEAVRVEEGTSATAVHPTRLDAMVMDTVATTSATRRLADLVSLAPGVTVQHNGLMHVRGIEDGLLYVVDGIPLGDRLDTLHATGFEASDLDTVDVVAGHMPAEFGGRNAAVVVVQPRSALGRQAGGRLTLSAGNEGTRLGSGAYGLRIQDRGGIQGALAFAATDRFLDPPDERNFNNDGERLSASLGGEWRVGSRDTLVARGFTSGSRFDVPTDAEQEAAGQRQRQRTRDDSQSMAWRRAWSDAMVTDVAAFRDARSGRLRSSPQDVPVSADANRQHRRLGALAGITRSHGAHLLKAGVQVDRLSVSEQFVFAVTDRELAEARDVSDAAMRFGPAAPFVFADRARGVAMSAYVQDAVSPLPSLNVSAGVRVDRSALPQGIWQVGPRVGVAWSPARTGTEFRGSADRLFMPPQIEYLLLANSEEARALSPFETADSAGGLAVRPERVWAYEVGARQRLGGLATLDVAGWWRRITDPADPNVLFNTTIVFPNSVAYGTAEGFDVRLAVPWRSLLARAAYTYARVEHVGPLTGGLFLTDEFPEIADGTPFTPDHDQRRTATGMVSYRSASRGWWVSAATRYQSGVPLEIEDEALDRVRTMAGAELVDFARRRVRAWTVVDAAASVPVRVGAWRPVVRVDAQNLLGRRFVFNFGSPFEGTHFGYPRRWRVSLAHAFR